MANRSVRRHRSYIVAKQRWMLMKRWARPTDPPLDEPVGKFRKYNLSCNCLLCSEGDKLQRVKLERRSPLLLED
jgi:hypothetical protein